MKIVYRLFFLSVLLFTSSLIAQSLDMQWAGHVAAIMHSASGEGIVSDNDGNVFVTGSFSGPIDFDPGSGVEIFSTNSYDNIFIQKLDAGGNLLWVKVFGVHDVTSYIDANDIAVDDNGNVFVTGEFRGIVDFDPNSGNSSLYASSNSDAFVVKLNANGDLVWAKSIGGVGYDVGTGIVVDSNGSVFSTGYFMNTVDFDTDSISEYNLTVTDVGKADAFIKKMDSDGNFQWVRSLSGGTISLSNDITFDINGNLLLTGFYEDTVDFDPGIDTFMLTSNGYEDIFVLNLSKDGDFLWANGVGGAQEDKANSITTDTDGNIFVTGFFRDTVDFDPGLGVVNLQTDIYQDIFIQKLNQNGDLVWVKQIGSNNTDNGQEVLIDPDDNLIVLGNFVNIVDFDPGVDTVNLVSWTGNDVFMLKLDNNGNYIHVDHISGPGEIHVKSGFISPNGNVYTTGTFNALIDFDPGPDTLFLTSTVNSDMFIEKLTMCSTDTTQVITVCDSLDWINGVTYSTSTSDILYVEQGSNGCDSVVHLDLTVNSISNNTVSVTGAVLTSNNSLASHVWLNCDNNYSIIPGETDLYLLGQPGGSYAVELTENGCVDTSACITLEPLNIPEGSYSNTFMVYPNPNTGTFMIETQKIQSKLSVKVFTIFGQELLHKTEFNTNKIPVEVEMPFGVYMVEVVDESGFKSTVKVLKR